MLQQHSTEEAADQEQGIAVPLELEGLRILKQEVQADGTLRVEVIGTNERASCPHWKTRVCQTARCASPKQTRCAAKRASGGIGALQTTVRVLAMSQRVHRAR